LTAIAQRIAGELRGDNRQDLSLSVDLRPARARLAVAARGAR